MKRPSAKLVDLIEGAVAAGRPLALTAEETRELAAVLDLRSDLDEPTEVRSPWPFRERELATVGGSA